VFLSQSVSVNRALAGPTLGVFDVPASAIGASPFNDKPTVEKDVNEQPLPALRSGFKNANARIDSLDIRQRLAVEANPLAMNLYLDDRKDTSLKNLIIYGIRNCDIGTQGNATWEIWDWK